MYPGGKNGGGAYQTLINLMPPHSVYIEPFLGSGAVMRMKRPARVNIGLDLDGEVLAIARIAILREHAGENGRNGDERRRGSSELASSAENAETGEGYLNAETGDGPGCIAGSAERRQSSEQPLASIAIADVVRSLNTGPADVTRFVFEVRDGINYLAGLQWSGAELVYCDPPYRMSTRRSGKLYKHEMTDLQHRRLLRVLLELPCMVMLSGYWSPMYSKTLEGWNSIRYQAMTRGGKPATEWVWFNFPPPVALHDYRYLGKGFRERERIKRKKARWTARLGKMPVLERQSLLAAIEAFSAQTGDGGSEIAGSGEAAGSSEVAVLE
jgi:DNA adenine methylase